MRRAGPPGSRFSPISLGIPGLIFDCYCMRKKQKGNTDPGGRRVVSSREFQHRFSGLAGGLEPGETLTVIRRGEPLGYFTKARKPFSAPDFLANIERLKNPAGVGQELIDEICG